MFVKGQVVVCIDNEVGGWFAPPVLTIGKIYCIISAAPRRTGGQTLRITDDKGRNVGLYCTRFRPAEVVAAPSIPEVVISGGEIKCSR